MEPSGYADALVYSAIRMTGPLSGPTSSQLITNGDFESDLSEWTLGAPTQQETNFVWRESDKKALVFIPDVVLLNMDNTNFFQLRFTTISSKPTVL
jgi:hypothetical protein